MSKIELHLKYKKETGKDRPDVHIIAKAITDKSEEIEIWTNDDLLKYIDWLEEAVDSVLSANEKLLDQLRAAPKEITIKE